MHSPACTTAAISWARSPAKCSGRDACGARSRYCRRMSIGSSSTTTRSEEHTSELQSQSNLVCRLLLEKKKNDNSLRDESYQHWLQPAPPSNGSTHALSS